MRSAGVLMVEAYLETHPLRSRKHTERVRCFLERLQRGPLHGAENATPVNNCLAILQAVADRMIPQADDVTRIAIACILLVNQKKSPADGWRFADMPPDEIALVLGLQLLDLTALQFHNQPFASLAPSQQDELLQKVQSGEVDWQRLNGRHWFEDLLAALTEIYVFAPRHVSRDGVFRHRIFSTLAASGLAHHSVLGGLPT